MGEQLSQLGRQFAGATNPRRHRARRRRIVFSLLCGALAGVVCVAALVRMAATAALGAREVPDAASNPPVVAPAEPEPARISLMMVGDVLMHEGIIYGGDKGDGSFDYHYLFDQVADDVAAADVAVVNQETILGGRTFAYAGFPQFNSPQELGDAEVDAGFDVVLKATNHTLDLGYDGIRTELAYWRDSHPQMAVIGCADPDGDHGAPAGGTTPAGPYVVEKDGLRIALLNYTDIYNFHIDYAYDDYVVSNLIEEYLRADVAAAREVADLVVVMPHWGDEYVTVPNERQRWWADVMLDAGVDVVIGGHPHVIQPVELLVRADHKMLVFWSVGNFVSCMQEAYKVVGGMAKVSFVKDDAGARIESYEFVPLVCQFEPYSTNLKAYRLDRYTDELAARSLLYNTDPGNGSTRAWFEDFCAGVLGEAYDRATMTVHATL